MAVPYVAHSLPAGTTARPAAPRWTDVLLGLLLAGVTVWGLFETGAYHVSPGVRTDFPDVMRGQDVVTLLTVPLLLIAGRGARSGSLASHLVRLGLLLYYAYTYLIYAFSPWNDAFPAYCAVIGLSAWGLLDGLSRLDASAVRASVRADRSRGTGAFLVGVGALFLLLWTAMIAPAVVGDGLPAGRVTYDIASAVHVLDLSLVLPLVVTTGVLLWRRRPEGVVLGVVVLCKIVTLGTALLAMNLLFAQSPNVGETALWAVVAGVALTLLVRLVRRVGSPDGPWLHPGPWH